MSFDVKKEAKEQALKMYADGDPWPHESWEASLRDFATRAIEATEEECIGDVCLTCLAAQYGTRKPAELFIDRGIETWAHFGADESFTYCDAAHIHERRRRRKEVSNG